MLSTVPAFPVNDHPTAPAVFARFTQAPLVVYHGELVVVSNTIIPALLLGPAPPAAVTVIDNLAVESISGSCIPWVPDWIDKMTFGLGGVVGFVALITTVCEYAKKTDNRKPEKSKNNFIVWGNFLHYKNCSLERIRQ
jgi:hypothetical protein